MSIFLLDNYDSFTYNLYQYLCELGAEVTVARNDQISLDEVAAMEPERIVVSPGPKRPEDAGISVELIRRFAAGSSESAGEHFTPRDVVRLATSGGQVSRYGHPVARGGSGSLPARRLLWPPCPSTPPS